MIVAMVVLGGMGHLPGVILGALLLSALPEVLRYVAGPLQQLTGGRLDASILRLLLFALAMIGIMLSRPRGLWPSPEHGKARDADAAGRDNRRAQPVGPNVSEATDRDAAAERACLRDRPARHRRVQALRRPAGAVRRRHHDRAQGQIYGLIGPNGAGKTTFFNVLTGLYTPDSGSFELGGKPYKPTAVHEVAKAGIARTFQNIRLFADMTALENVMVGRHVRTQLGPGRRGLPHAAASRPRRRRSRARAQELLDYVGIGGFADYKARTLSATATSAASRSRARSPPTRSCSRSTSRPPA